MAESINNMDVCVLFICELFTLLTNHQTQNNNVPPMITEPQLHTNRQVCIHGIGKTTVWQRYTAARGGNYIKVEILTCSGTYFIQINQWITAWVEVGISWDMQNYIQTGTQFRTILKALFWNCSNTKLPVIYTTLFTGNWKYYINTSTYSPRHTVHIIFICLYRHKKKKYKIILQTNAVQHPG